MLKVLLLMLNFLLSVDAARILVVVAAPSLSHQLFFRPLTEELVKRGHVVTVITTDPAYSNDEPPQNFTEIDVHNVSYTIYRSVFCKQLRGKYDMHIQFTTLLDALTKVFEAQFRSEPVQNLLHGNQKFDLVIVEAYYRILAVYAHIFKVPVILVSSFGMSISNGEITGTPVHPLYPSAIRQSVVNLSLWEYVKELYNEYWSHRQVYAHESIENSVLKKLLPDAPTISELLNNVHLMMLNVFPQWEWNRPVPPGVVFLGTVIQKSEKALPQDLKSYLDNSKHGVIYISFGTNVIEALLPPQRIEMFNKVLSELPYDVIWKWGSNHTYNTPKNVKLLKWLPQPELLKHPNVKLFITQGGIHSTYEAIQAAVPMIGIPMSLDQWFQTEHYGHKGIGIRLPFEIITEEVLKKTIKEVIENDRYRRDILRLRWLTSDQPHTPLQRFVWWTEHVLRHGGNHLRAPGANMCWAEILELELVFIILASVIVFMSLTVYLFMKTVKYLKMYLKRKK